MIAKCDNCKKEEKIENLNPFHIPVKICAISHAKEIGRKIVFICNDCLKERGRPIEEYMDSLIFEKEL